MSEIVGGVNLKSLGSLLCIDTVNDCIDLDRDEVVELRNYLNQWLEQHEGQ